MVERIILEGEWLSGSQAANRLGVTASRFYELVREGRVTYETLPNGRLYEGGSVDRLRAELDASPHRPDGAAAS